MPSRLSKLPCTLRGGVRGCLGGLSVGRSTAGTYMGDFRGRSCFVCKGRSGYKVEFCGDVGEAVPKVELVGDSC